MSKTEFELVGTESNETQFRVEGRPDGLWSGGPEITIVREFNGKRDQFGPSIPVENIPDLIHALLTQYTRLIQSKE